MMNNLKNVENTYYRIKKFTSLKYIDGANNHGFFKF